MNVLSLTAAWVAAVAAFVVLFTAGLTLELAAEGKRLNTQVAAEAGPGTRRLEQYLQEVSGQ